MMKLVITGRRRPGQSLRAHRRHMKDVHAPIVLENIAVEPDRAPHRYVQNHVFDGQFADGAGPLSVARDFVTEVWFPNPETARAARETPFYLERLRGDEANMVDEASVIGTPVVEQLVRGSPAISTCPIKVFAFLSLTAGAASPEFETAWKQAVRTSALGGALQHVVSRPLATTPIQWIDAFWLPDEDAAQDLEEAYRAEVIAPLEAAGLLAPGGANLLLARQYVIHAGDRQFDISHSEEMQ